MIAMNVIDDILSSTVMSDFRIERLVATDSKLMLYVIFKKEKYEEYIPIEWSSDWSM